MTTEELIKLKNSLPKNYLDKLHESTGFSRPYICQVINGERKNFEIIDAAIILAKEEKIVRENRKSEVESL